MTDDRRGILARAGADDAEEVLVATLDFERLQRVVEEYPIYAMFNYEMYQKELPGVYAAYRATELDGRRRVA